MSGTKAGGKKAAATNKAKHGADFYAMIGRKGGKNGHTGGFASNPELARLAGRKGGLISSKDKHKAPIGERRNEIEELLRQEEELTFYEKN